jgi:hypothetical protein
MPVLTDDAGVEIRVGDTVRQAGASGTRWYNPALGALLANAGERGIVVGLGRTRARVDFGRTKRDVFGTVGTDEPIIDVVHTSMLTVVKEAPAS